MELLKQFDGVGSLKKPQTLHYGTVRGEKRLIRRLHKEEALNVRSDDTHMFGPDCVHSSERTFTFSPSSGQRNANRPSSVFS
jgi:hypothetical protein